MDLERYLRRHKLTLARSREMPPSNPIPAGRAFHWIDQRDQALAKRAAKAILDAYWREGNDIGSSETVITIARRVGADATALQRGFTNGEADRLLALRLTALWRWECSGRRSSSLMGSRSSASRRWNSSRSGSPPAAGDRRL